MHDSDFKEDKEKLENRWASTLPIKGLHYTHSRDSIGVAQTVNSRVNHQKIVKLSVNDVYSDSKEDNENPDEETLAEGKRNYEYCGTDENGTSEENGGSTNQDECSSDVNEDPDCLAAVTPEAIKPGAFILVNFESQKKKVYTYVATCQTLLCQNEVQVMCLNKCGQSLSLFKLNEKDISYVQYTQIVGIIPYLNITQRGIYKFPIPLKMVYERV